MKKRIPYPFKLVAYVLIITAFGFSITANIDDFRKGFREGYAKAQDETIEEWQTFEEWMPEKKAIPWRRASIICSIAGFVLLVFARDKEEDEFRQTLRLKSVLQAFFYTYIFVGIHYMITTDNLFLAFEVLNLQLFIYLILYGYKKHIKYLP